MKIAYLFSWDLSKKDGVSKKIIQQITSWQELGHSVNGFCITANKDNIVENINNYEFGIFSSNEGPSRLIKDLEKYNPDIIYFRFEIWKPWFKIVLKKYKTIIEINSNDITELKLQSKKNMKSKLIFYWNLVTRHILFRYCKAIIFVTYELSESKKFSFIKKRIVIPNSIVSDSLPTIKNENSNSITFFLIVSSPDPWQGVDNAITLVKKLGDPFKLIIIGAEGVSVCEPQVEIFGYLSGEEVRQILARCHIALGTMALYKKHMEEACPLKIRESCTMGFPAVIAYKDTAFVEGNPDWILELPNNELSFTDDYHLSKVKDFAVTMKNRIVRKEESAIFFDAKVFEAKRIFFMNEIMDD